MSSTKNVTALFDDIAENMLQFFEGWDKHVPHDGEKGGVRERRVLDFLKKYLPSKYGVASGHIIDRNGEISLQEDIVIFDSLNCPILQIDPYYQVFPCESVYATIEVKSVLNPEKIKECINHTQQLRKLYRGDGGTLKPIENFVFAYDSYDSQRKSPMDWASEQFKEKTLGMQKESMPSLVLCLKKKFILHLGGGDGRSICIPDRLESGILLYFFEMLLTRISRADTAPTSLFTQYGWEKDNPIIRSKNTWVLDK